MRQIQNKSFGRKLFNGLVALVLPVLPGCFTGGGVEPIVGFNARAIKDPMGMKYDPAVSIGVRGRAKTKSNVEVEAEASTFTTSGEAGIVNHDITATELSANVLYPVLSNGKGDIYVGAGVTTTNQTVTETFDGFSGSTSGSQSETEATVFAGGRYNAGKGAVDVRVSPRLRGLLASIGYEFRF